MKNVFKKRKLHRIKWLLHHTLNLTAKITVIVFAGSILVVLLTNLHVNNIAKKHVYDNIALLPLNNVAVVLGTSKYRVGGTHNLFYRYRIDAVVELYKAGKIKYIIASGDNRNANYNEPAQMTKDLVAAGIPRERIFQDYAGLRTLDSVIRAKKVFGQSSFTIVSQRFHVKRAVYIARRNGIQVIAYTARDVPLREGLVTHIRELLAKVKVVLDVSWLHKQPRHLGEPVFIPLD